MITITMERENIIVGHSRREDPDDNTVPYQGEDREEDVEDGEHVVEKGVGSLEAPPEGVDVVEVIRGRVVTKHLHLVACGCRHLRPHNPGRCEGSDGRRKEGVAVVRTRWKGNKKWWWGGERWRRDE